MPLYVCKCSSTKYYVLPYLHSYFHDFYDISENKIKSHYNPTNRCDNYLWHSTYWCCYYITMAMEVLINTCNMCICDLSDMYAFSCRAAAYISGKSVMTMLQLLHVRMLNFYKLQIHT